MLVLSRKKNESIVINNDIVITVVEIRGDKVRLGIVAPKEVPVHRQEVFDAIHGRYREETREGSQARPVEADLPQIVDMKLSEGATVRFTAEGGFSVE